MGDHNNSGEGGGVGFFFKKNKRGGRGRLFVRVHNLLKLKALVKDGLPSCEVFVSTPTLRTDDGKTQITVSQLTKHLLQLMIDTVNNNNNNNINIRHLGGKGLHLNQSGSKRLSKNFLNAIEKF